MKQDINWIKNTQLQNIQFLFVSQYSKQIES